MPDISPNFIRGFLVPHNVTSDNIWTSQSSFSQQGNIAGDPEPQQNSRLVVRSTGSQTAATDISIISRRAGHVNRGAGFTWKNNALASGEQGQDQPNTISEFEFIGRSDGTGVTEKYQFPYPLDLGDGTCLISCQVITTASRRQIRVFKRDRDGGYTSTNLKTWDPTITALLSEPSYPILIQTPDNDILCLFFVEDTDQDILNMSVYRSTDLGSTFTEISRTALQTPIDVNAANGNSIKRLRGASLGGQVLIFVETHKNGSATKYNQLFQFCSLDGGGNFKQVTPVNKLDTYSFYQVDCFIRDETFILTYIAATNSAHYMKVPQGYHSVHLLRDASKYSTITTETIAGGTSANMTTGQSTSWVDDNGVVFCIFTDSNREYLFVRYSVDGGNTFKFMNGNFSATKAAVYDVSDTGTFPADIKAISTGGRSILCSNWTLTSGFDLSATMLNLGGWSNVNLPLQTLGYQDDVGNRAGFDFTYIPLDLPADVSSITVAGAGTQTLVAEGLKVSTNTTQTITYTVNTTGVIALARPVKITGRIALKTNASGSLTAPWTAGKRELRLVISNGSNSYEVSIRITATQYQVYDINGSAGVGSIQNVTSTDGIELLFAIDGSSFSIWHKQITNGNNKIWITGPTTNSLSDGGAVAVAAQMIFSHAVAIGSGTMETTIREWLSGYASTPAVLGTSGGIAGQGMGIGFNNPTDLAVAAYPPIGTYKYINEGVKITTQLGPAFEGDQYRIKTRYTYPIENTIYKNSPTPRIFWRSTAVGAGAVPEQFIAIALDAASQSANQDMGNNLIGFHLGNINFKQFNIEYYNTGAGSWTNIKTVDVSTGLTFNYTHSNSAIIGIGGGTNEPYIQENEAEGWIAELTQGGTVERFRVISNSAGKCGSTAYKRPVFRLDGVPSAGGVCRLIPKNVTVLVNALAAAGTGWGIRVTSQETIDKYVKIGQLLLGPVVTGVQYSWGRTINLEHNIATYETPDRIQYTREISKPRRTVSVAWTEGVDVSTVMGDNPTPDVYSGSTSAGAEPIASPQDIPFKILGMYSYLNGPLNPTVYLPSIKRSGGSGTDAIILNRYHEHVLCVLNESVSIDNVLGDEMLGQNEGEVFRVSTLNLVEVI